MKNNILIASAGSGKTTHLVEQALRCKDNVLMTTFTEENKKEMETKIYKLNNGAIPHNITIRTWFSFLIEHGIKPFQGYLTDKKIKGMLLVNKKSGFKYYNKTFPVYYKEDDVEQHYFSKEFKIYSDKLSKFTIRSNDLSNGSVINRISNIFKHVIIDEVQDMAGYDLEIIKQLFQTDAAVTIAGDPRQVTYHTHFPDKYKKYSNGNFKEFLQSECKKIDYNLDTSTLKDSWRNNQFICDFANSLFPDLPHCNSLHNNITGHDGIFLVRKKDLANYLSEFNPTQLRYSRSTKVDSNFEVKNFGESKGITRDRVLIYPTKKINDWLLNNKDLDTLDIKCKLYVAITRAKFSVAFVCKNDFESDILPFFK